VTERERFQRLFAGKAVDRPPLLEEGVREEVIELWHAQGMPAGRTHIDIFGLTPHETVGPDLRPEASVEGRILSLSPADYRRAFRASRRRFPADWDRTVRRLEHREHIACVWASRGFFQALGVGDWPTLELALQAVVSEPATIRSRLEMYGEFCAAMLDFVLRDLEPDFVYLSEPISDNKSTLISPAMFEEFALPAYARIIDTARAHGCSNVLVSTYGNSSLLLPGLLRTGVSMLWISDAAGIAEVDYRNLRLEYGPSLGLIGGIPLAVLGAASRDQMNRQLQDFVIPLLQSGRYVPLAGGRIREDVPWAAYRDFRELLVGIFANRGAG
jgi:hypothetical protein